MKNDLKSMNNLHIYKVSVYIIDKLREKKT